MTGDLTSFIDGNRTLLISDFEGTTPIKHFEEFESYCTNKGGKQNLIFLGDVFDNTAQFGTCTGEICEEPDIDDTNCVGPENYFALKTIKLLNENETSCRYVIGNRDLNKIKIWPYFQLENQEKWWDNGESYEEIVKNFLNMKEKTWMVKTVHYFKPFWQSSNKEYGKQWDSNEPAADDIYKRFEQIFGKDPKFGTMSALVTLKCLPDELMFNQDKTMNFFYKKIDELESINYNPEWRQRVRAALTIVIFMRMLDHTLESKIEVGTLGSLEGILYNYLLKAKPAYYAEVNNKGNKDLFLFAHGGITSAFVKGGGEEAFKELDKTSWSDLLKNKITVGGSNIEENPIVESINKYNLQYEELLKSFFSAESIKGKIRKYDPKKIFKTELKEMLRLLRISAGADLPRTLHYPNQVKEPSDELLDDYKGSYDKVFNVFGHASASSFYSFGKPRDKKTGNLIGTESKTYFLSTDYSTTLFKNGIICEPGSKYYDENYLLCILDTSVPNDTKLVIEGKLILKKEKSKNKYDFYPYNFYKNKDFALLSELEKTALGKTHETIDSFDNILETANKQKLILPNDIKYENNMITIDFDKKQNLLAKEIDDLDNSNTSKYCKFNGIATVNNKHYAVYSNMFKKVNDKNMSYSIVLIPNNKIEETKVTDVEGTEETGEILEDTGALAVGGRRRRKTRKHKKRVTRKNRVHHKKRTHHKRKHRKTHRRS